MKKINLICICLATIISLSQASAQMTTQCLGEAQIIAKITGRSTDSLTTCTAQIDASSVRLYNQNGQCPMDLSEVISQGIEMGLTNGHDCDIYIGDEINGIIYKRIDGKIAVE